jgi:hypothetical protein
VARPVAPAVPPRPAAREDADLAIPVNRTSTRLPLLPWGRIPSRVAFPASTIFLSVVYLAGAAVALALGGPAQRLLGVAVVTVTIVRLALLWSGHKGAA